MNIRSATIHDLSRILEIYNDSILNSTSVYEYKVFTAEVIERWFAAKVEHHFPVLVLEVNQEMVGFTTYGTFRTRAAYKYTVEHSVYIHPDYRRKGYGRILLGAIITKAEKNGLHTMIGGIDSSNSASIAIHHEFGFEECGRIKEVAWKFDRWLDLILMQKNFPGPIKPTED
jgi:L-amino acid N-acyltransferase